MIKLYIANLGKYNEGELVGDWITLPYTEEELNDLFVKIKLGSFNTDGDYQHGLQESCSFYEEYAIHDYETDLTGLTINEYSDLNSLNELAEKTEAFDETELKALQAFLEDGCKFNDAVEHVTDSDYIVWSNCDDMSDVAAQVIEESSLLENVSDIVARYFDYEAYGNDLEIEGNYHYIDGDYIELTY
jgi:antirestriction protein